MSILVGATSACAGAAGSQAAAADLGETIEQSLRFRAEGSATYLSNTGIVGGATGNYTVSFWAKVGHDNLTSSRFILTSGTAGTNTSSIGYCNNGIDSQFQFRDGGSTTLQTGVRHRDPSAWYHVVCQQDADNNTQKIFVNGDQVGTTNTGSSASGIFSQSPVAIAYYAGSVTNGWEGYLAEFNFLETVLAPTDFARYNDDGVWVPKALDFTSAQYGASGFRLKFDSSADGGVGDDSAPTGTGHTSANDFTANNIQTTAISSSNFDNDIDYEDTPTSNYSVVNGVGLPIQADTSEANLRVASGATQWQTAYGTLEMTTGKWYWEVNAEAIPAGGILLGVGNYEVYVNRTTNNYIGQTSNGYGYYNADGTKYNFDLPSPHYASYGDSWTTGDIIGFAFDADTKTLWASKNGTWQNSATLTEVENGTTTNSMFTGMTGDRFAPAISSSRTTNFAQVNFGQRDFIYTQPSGYNALQTNNLPEPTIKNGSDHFRVLTGTGANILGIAQGSNTNGTNWNDDVDTGFSDGMYWIKDRDNDSTRHQMFNSISGTSKVSDWPAVRASQTYSAPSGNSVAWVWSAPDSFTGTTNTTCRENSDAGFTMVDSGTNVVTSYLHGLGQIPDWIIFKNHAAQNVAVIWPNLDSTQVVGLDGSGSPMAANPSGSTGWFIGDGITSTTVNLGSYANTNPFMAYHWKNVEGYSKFGRYFGNESADGPYVHLGFRPAWILVRRFSTANWRIFDSTRNTTNPCDQILWPNLSDNEGVDPYGNGDVVDFLSNGFKVRAPGTTMNVSGGYIYYAAFAESPFGGENAPPVTAR